MPSREKQDKDSEEDDAPEQSVFREVSEVRFKAEVGPLGTHRLCTIQCIEGMWQGPLCAAPEQDDSGQLKFEPLYKRCVVDQIPPHLLLSYKNVSVVSALHFLSSSIQSPPTYIYRLLIGIFHMDIHCKHVVMIWVYIN